ncbi:MAG: hypothetical protein JSR45_13490 [Proteobacteria bacterium]|nr:hypothetical protein [Pseudomonadota bacterium]
MLASLAALALLAQTSAAAPPAPPPPACASADHHAFDFWIGKWTVTTKDGRHAGDSLIESLYGGCVLRENWSQPGFAGGSLNILAEDGRWHQAWTDQSGALREFVGGMEGGKMVLVAHVVSKRFNNRPALVRMTFTPNPDGSVRQYSDLSLDDGETWTERYDFTYRRAG